MELLYKELSFEIVGCAFKVYNDLGYGLPEKHYQLALAKIFKDKSIAFKREQYVEIKYLGETIGKYFLDFVVDNKVVVELKVQSSLGYVHIKQVMGYLKSLGLKLAILLYFTKNGVKYRRIVSEI